MKQLQNTILLQDNQTDFYSLTWILVMNPRMHMWIQTGEPAMYELGYTRFINQTLNDYISHTPNISQIYNNSEIYIYEILFNFES